MVSLKLMIDYPDVVERINAALPEQVGRTASPLELWSGTLPSCLGTPSLQYVAMLSYSPCVFNQQPQH